jgi:hypothetical protein
VEPLLCGYLAAVTEIEQAVAAVPAHNALNHLPRCLCALTAAAGAHARHIQGLRPGVTGLGWALPEG